MMNKVIILRVGSNFYDKPGALYPLDIEDGGYKTEVYFDKNTFEKLIVAAKDYGFDTVMLNLGEGIVYDSHPEIAIKGSMPKAEFKTYLNKIRELGMKVAPMLDFSALRNAWTGEYCTTAGSLWYKDFCCDILTEILELFENPEFCHLGFESEIMEKQENQAIMTRRNQEVLRRDMRALFDICDKFGTRPWIWIDEHSIEFIGGRAADKEDIFKSFIPKNTILSYLYFPPIYPHYVEQGRVKEEMKMCDKICSWGYDVYPMCSTWFRHESSRDMINYHVKCVGLKSVKGWVCNPNAFTVDSKYYWILNDMFRFADAQKEFFNI